MTTLTPTNISREADARATALTDPDGEMTRLGEAIAELAARLHAATYQLLVLLRQFDDGAGWICGFLSCAHWLHWRTGIDLGAAREKVRVARALAILPVISGAMERGELSYAKVRALTRIATAENERQLLDVALAGTAAHVERIVRAWRRADRIEAAQMTERRHHARHVTTWVDEDGMVVIRGRLTPEIGAIVQRALESAAEQLLRESVGSPNGGRVVDEVTPGQRRADALARLAEVALAGDLDHGTPGDRYQVVVHVDRAALDSTKTTNDADTGYAVIDVDYAPTSVSRKRLRGSRAMRRSSSWSMARMAPCSMSGARRARFHRRFGAPSRRVIAAASFPDARRAAATGITSDIGPRAVRRASTISSCSVEGTTGLSMKRDFVWCALKMGPQSSFAPTELGSRLHRRLHPARIAIPG